MNTQPEVKINVWSLFLLGKSSDFLPYKTDTLHSALTDRLQQLADLSSY